MALDYSKLSDAELEAIANDDYSKLSDATLQAIIDEGASTSQQSTAEPSVSLAPQAARAGMEVARLAPGATSAGYNLAKQGASAAKEFIASRPVMQTAADVAGIATHGVPWGSIAKQALDPNAMNIGQMVSKAGNVAKQVGPVLANAGRAVGGAVMQGAMAPENLLTLPYQMAAYEQEKIRANPNAPGLEYNPYAQTVRGEYATQGQAGAANARRAVTNMPFGNVTAEERAILEQDRQRQLATQQRKQQARQVLQQPPTAQNFIERSRALAELYGGVGQ